MEKKQSVKPRQRPLDPAELREVTGRGRIRIPIGYTDDGQPVYAEDEGGGSDEDGLSL